MRDDSPSSPRAAPLGRPAENHRRLNLPLEDPLAALERAFLLGGRDLPEAVPMTEPAHRSAQAQVPPRIGRSGSAMARS